MRVIAPTGSALVGGVHRVEDQEHDGGAYPRADGYLRAGREVVAVRLLHVLVGDGRRLPFPAGDRERVRARLADVAFELRLVPEFQAHLSVPARAELRELRADFFGALRVTLGVGLREGGDGRGLQEERGE